MQAICGKMSVTKLKLSIIVALSLLTTGVYARTAWYPFSGNDDPEYVTQNFHVLSGLSLEALRWAFSSFHAANWHPLTWLSLMLDAQLFGTNPMGFHLVNLLFHLLSTTLLFLLLSFMTGVVWPSAFVAALFALHPLHVESVIWITERKDVLSTLFWMITLFLYVGYVKKSSKPMYLLSLLAFGLGLMAKPMLVTIPVVLLLLDIWPLGRLPAAVRDKSFPGGGKGGAPDEVWRLFLEKLPFFALSAGLSVITLHAQQQTVASMNDVPLSMRVPNALWSIILYAAKTAVPVNLSPFYPFLPVPFWKTCLAVALLGIALVLMVRTWRNRPYVTVGLLWYLVSLLPVIGLIQVGSQAMADRYTYVPLVGLFITASWGLAEAVQRAPGMKNIIIVLAAGILAAHTVATWTQVSYWKDDNTLYTHALAVTPDNSFARNMLGIAYEKEGNGAFAVREYTESLRISPDDAGTHLNLGLVLDNRLGMPEKAIKHYEIAARLEPQNPFAHYHMARSLQKMGHTSESVAEYRKALAIRPTDPYFHNDLGMALLQLNNVDEAIAHLKEALRFLPSFQQAASNLQFALRLKANSAGAGLESR